MPQIWNLCFYPDCKKGNINWYCVNNYKQPFLKPCTPLCTKCEFSICALCAKLGDKVQVTKCDKMWKYQDSDKIANGPVTLIWNSLHSDSANYTTTLFISHTPTLFKYLKLNFSFPSIQFDLCMQLPSNWARLPYWVNNFLGSILKKILLKWALRQLPRL